MNALRTVLLSSLMCVAIGSAVSIESVRAASPVDVYQFENDAQRERYRALIEEFRCPKCLNTNIAGSDAPIAKDLRAAVHRLIVLEGMTDQQIRDYLQARYGDFVLYKPPFNAQTYLIWLVPVGIGVVGIAVIAMMVRRARKVTDASLSEDEQRRIEQLLRDD